MVDPYPVDPLVTATDVLAFVGLTQPTAADTEWATLVAAAIDDEIRVYLDWPELEDGATPPAEWRPGIVNASRLSSSEDYRRRDAAFGTTGFTDLQTGGAIRLARDYLEGVKPMLWRYKHVAGLIA